MEQTEKHGTVACAQQNPEIECNDELCEFTPHEKSKRHAIRIQRSTALKIRDDFKGGRGDVRRQGKQLVQQF